MKYKKIIVTGGSGLVGRSLKEIMPNAKYLSSKDYDLTKESEVEKLFQENECDCLINLAAVVGGINANVANPTKYLNDNIIMNTFLLKYAFKNKINRVLSLVSTCAYPDKVEDNLYSMKEELLHEGLPASTNLGYGYSKRLLAVQSDIYNKQYGTQYQYLIPCNLYGFFDKYGDNSHFLASIIKKIHFALKNGDDKIILFGNGKSLRQFILGSNLAMVIRHCIENDVVDNFNVAPDENLSINEMVKIALKVMNAEHLTIQYDSSMSGQFRKDVSNAKMMSLIPDFRFTSLEDGIKQTYDKLLEFKTFENGNV